MAPSGGAAVTPVDDPFGDFIGSAPATNGAAVTDGGTSVASEAGGGGDLFGESGDGETEPKISTKASIMALYGPPSQPGAQQMYGVPGTSGGGGAGAGGVV